MGYVQCTSHEQKASMIVVNSLNILLLVLAVICISLSICCADEQPGVQQPTMTESIRTSLDSQLDRLAAPSEYSSNIHCLLVSRPLTKTKQQTVPPNNRLAAASHLPPPSRRLVEGGGNVSRWLVPSDHESLRNLQVQFVETCNSWGNCNPSLLMHCRWQWTLLELGLSRRADNQRHLTPTTSLRCLLHLDGIQPVRPPRG